MAVGTGAAVAAVSVGLGMAIERHRVVCLFTEHVRDAGAALKAGEDWATEKLVEMGVLEAPTERLASQAIVSNLRILEERVRKGVRVKGGS